MGIQHEISLDTGLYEARDYHKDGSYSVVDETPPAPVPVVTHDAPPMVTHDVPEVAPVASPEPPAAPDDD